MARNRAMLLTSVKLIVYHLDAVEITGRVDFGSGNINIIAEWLGGIFTK